MELDTEKDGPRIVRCTIQMDFIEGEHFNPFNKELTNEEAISYAVSSFLDILNVLDEDYIEDYVQTKIVEDVS